MAVALNTDASRSPPGFLTPTSQGSLNRHDEASGPFSEGGKRKRFDSTAVGQMLKQPIAVKPHPSNLQSQPRMLLPLMLVARQHLPLSFFDLASPSGDLPPSRLYESHVKILDLESRMSDAIPNILIVRHEPKGTLYALERQDDGLYVVCKVGSWVDLGKLSCHASVCITERFERPKSAVADRESQPQHELFLQLSRSQKAKRQAIETIQSLVRKRACTGSATFSSGTVKAEEVTKPKPEQVEPVPEALAVQSPMPQAADGVFDNIRTAYIDTLYKSRGSLAYFAKGPLSRARSTFTLDLELDSDINDLLNFLKSLLLTTIQIDKKYHETLPGLINNMQRIIDTSDEGPKRKRKPKRMKLSKNCLYPLEDECIRQWWSVNKADLETEDEKGVSPQQLKVHAAVLRTRETLLQMILIMEIMAIESEIAKQAPQTLPALPGASNSPVMVAPTPKKRNKHNLPVLIDVHVDRLTIWQSTATDEQILLEDSQVPQAFAQGQAQQKSSEPLKDFCVDVIIPFFAARLPQLCDSLSRKLGGPIIIAPAKTKSAKPKRDQKPGSATKRLDIPKAISLQRALSNEEHHRRSLSRGPSSALALMRSTRAASIQSIKREGSEPPKLRSRGGVEGGKPKTGPLSRTSSGMLGLQDARARNKAKVEEELKDAISALRKPNRGVVGKAMAEDVERKVAVTKSASKPRRTTLSSGVLIKATPANNRFRDAMAMASVAGTPLPSAGEAIPPSSIGLVPSTMKKVGSYRRSTDSPAVLVGDTPIKASSEIDIFARSARSADVLGITPIKLQRVTTFIRRPADEENASPSSSPIMERRTANAIFETPVKKTVLFATPMKKSVPRTDAGHGWEQGALLKSPEKKASIYDRLGWDNDDLDDL